MIYLDSNSTTRLDPRVARAMLEAAEFGWANPSSDHAPGRLARSMIANARHSVARLIGAQTDSIIFTSGATEALNLAILGSINAEAGARPHVVTAATEHSAVLGPLEQLEEAGRIEVTTLLPAVDGTVSARQVAAALRDDTALVAIGHGNNEMGAINPIHDIGRILAGHSALFLVDAVQTLGSMPPSVEECHIDLLAISAHKMHGPKGVGALYVRNKSQLRPLSFGGGQEDGLRPGTLPTELLAGFGKAAELATEESRSRAEKARALTGQLFSALKQRFPDIRLNGPADHRLPGNLNLTIPFVEADRLLKRLPDLAISRFSACHTGAAEASHVLWALGMRDPELHWTFRIGITSQTTSDEIEMAGSRLCHEIARMRGHS